jgi:hypothetical protein
VTLHGQETAVLGPARLSTDFVFNIEDLEGVRKRSRFLSPRSYRHSFEEREKAAGIF